MSFTSRQTNTSFIVRCFGYERCVIGNSGRGRPQADLLVPSDRLNCAIIEKTRQGKRLTKVNRPCARDVMNTSAIERQKLTIRLLSSKTRRHTVIFGMSRLIVQAPLNHLAGYPVAVTNSSQTITVSDGTPHAFMVLSPFNRYTHICSTTYLSGPLSPSDRSEICISPAYGSRCGLYKECRTAGLLSTIASAVLEVVAWTQTLQNAF